MSKVKYRRLIKRLKAKPCPCCGASVLYLGHTEGLRLGVECRDYEKGTGCGLTIDQMIPDRWPRGLKNTGKPMEVLDRYALEKAVKAWNRRTR